MIPLVLILGESNAVGLGSFAELTVSEALPNPGIKAWNIGTSDFSPLGFSDGATNEGGVGFEIGLVNAVRAGTVPEAYFFKRAVGGTRIDEWITGGQYNTVLFQRLNALKAKMTALGVQYQPIIWYSQGINDNIAATPGATWQARTTQHFAALREVFPTAHILMGLLTTPNAGYDVNLKAVATAGTNIQTVSSLSAPTQDGNHWNTAGYRMIGGRFMDKTLAILNPTSTAPASDTPILFFFGL
jgi:hypothetical protein